MDSPESRAQALRMLEAFASVGVSAFALTFVDIDRKRTEYRPTQTLAQIRPAIGYLLRHAGEKHLNLIVRPHPPADITLCQLDDLDAKAVARVHDLAFLTIMTSPSNYQCWVALQDRDPELARRFRKGMGADPNASGAVRMPGALNFKHIYRPLFPIVSLADAQPGRIVTRAEVEPFLAPEEPRKWVERISTSRPRRWPDYDRELRKAPANHAGNAPDRSIADIRWCMIALTWHFTPEQTATQLMEVSERAKQSGERYANRTVEAALRAIGRGR